MIRRLGSISVLLLGSAGSILAKPSIVWNTPLAHQTVWGKQVKLSATVQDTVGLIKVYFELDGGLLKEFTIEPNPGTYVMYWDTTNVPVGSHVLTAVADDKHGGQGVLNIPISVSPTPLTCQNIQIELTNEATTVVSGTFYGSGIAYIGWSAKPGTTSVYSSPTTLNHGKSYTVYGVFGGPNGQVSCSTSVPVVNSCPKPAIDAYFTITSALGCTFVSAY